MFPVPSQVVTFLTKTALSVLCGSSLHVCCSLIPLGIALVPLADRVCWRQRLLGVLPRSCSYQLYHTHNSCEWQEGLPLLSREGKESVARAVTSSDVEEVSDYFLSVEWFRKLWLISWFENGSGCKSVFREYKSQKHNSDKFGSFQFLQLIFTSNCHKNLWGRGESQGCIFLVTFEVSCFFPLENSCFLWVWTNTVKNVGFIL